MVVVAVHGGFAAVTQPRIHLEERSPRECILCCAQIRVALMYFTRIRLLSLARPGVSENVTDDTLAHLPEHLYTPCHLSLCVRPVSSD